MEDETIRILINKIENGLPDIKLRSIATLYTKITVGIIDPNTLPRYINLPGVLLQWINDNRARSQPLFKVLTIVVYFIKTEQGLVILQEYEALDFFQEYRAFLLEQQPRQDQYTNILENLIKQLLPLSTKQGESNEEGKPKQQKQSKTREQKEVQKEKAQKPKESIKITWIVTRQLLGKKQEDELYSLMMELRHSKRQLQLQWLKKIQGLVKYWGSKWFRFRNELINELTDQYSRTNQKWLIIDIIKAMIRGIGENAKKLHNDELLLLTLSGNGKLISQPQMQKLTIALKKQLFDSVYSSQLIDALISYNDSTKQSQLYSGLLEMIYQYSPKYFQAALIYTLKNQAYPLNIYALNKNIQYFSENFEDFPSRISKILSEAPQNWELTPQKFPALKNYLQNLEKNKNFTYIAKYKQGWHLGSNLHDIVEVMSNLQKGVEAIDERNGRYYIHLYLNCLLTLGVAVEKQDPLMTYYPTMKSLITKIAQRPSLRSILFEEILQSVMSPSAIKYASKNFSQADLSVLIFSEQTMFKKMFYQSFGDQGSLQSWLQVSMILVKKSREFCELSPYVCIFYSLTYHKNQKIKSISRSLIEGLSKKGKQIVSLCKLFSRSEEERSRISRELFGDNAEAILFQLSVPVNKSGATKKLLKISEASIQNYIQIIFNKDIEQQIRLNAARQLLQSLERIQLNRNLQDLLNVLSQNIARALSDYFQFSHHFLPLFIQINGTLSHILAEKNYLRIQNVVKLLQIQLPGKVIQILLQNICISCFKNPFSDETQAHFTSLLYPHISLIEMKVGGYLQVKEQNRIRQSNKTKLSLPNYEQTLEYSHFVQNAIYSTLNSFAIKLDQFFVSMVEKQIGSILHASKGYNDLHLLAYGFTFLAQHGISLPDKIRDYSSPLLNSLLVKDQSASNCQPISTIISIIGCKKSRQIHSILASNPSGMWKYPILLQMQSIDPSLMQLLVKGLIGINYGKQAILILRLVLSQAKIIKFTSITQTLILSSCIKFIRQDVDILLRKTAVCVLAQLYKTKNFDCQGWEDIFGSVVSIFLEQTFTISEANLLLNLIKTIIERNDDVFTELNIVKMLLQKIISLAFIPSLNYLTAAIIYEIINLIVVKKRDLLQKYELVDTSINFISSIFENKRDIDHSNSHLVSAICDYLYFQSNHDENLPKYLLTSTTLLKNLLHICKIELNAFDSKELLESIGRLLLKLSQSEEDLLIYKLNQLVKTQIKSTVAIICTNIKTGGLEYLKMVGWMMIIWLRNRQQLQPELGQMLAQIALSCSNPSLIKLIMPFSINAKTLFMNSKYLQQLLKENNAIIDNRLIKDSKDKKKKKVYQLDQKDLLALNEFLSLLTSLFYWEESLSIEELKQSQGLRKIIIFIQKMYSCGQWEEQITKSYLKVVTNMSLSKPFAAICSNRLTQNAVMVEEMINCVAKSQNSEGIVKLSLKLMSLFVHFESIRSMILRARVIEELSVRLVRGQERGDLNLEYILDIIELYLSFSSYKDSNTRVLNDKKILEVLLRILKLGKFSILQQKIVLLLSNLACYKSNKSTFMSNRDIHKVILGLLEDKSISYHDALLALLYNILYKNSAALKLYRRPEVIQVIKKASSKSTSDVNKALLQALSSDQSI